MESHIAPWPIHPAASHLKLATPNPSPDLYLSLHSFIVQSSSTTTTGRTYMTAMDALPGTKPVLTRMPALPPSDFLTPVQWEVFYALMDGALPGFTSKSRAPQLGETHHVALPDDEFDKILDEASQFLPEGQTRDDLADFLAARPASEQALRDDCLRTLDVSPGKNKLGPVMDMLNTRLGSLLLTGYWSPVTAQPAHVRHAIIKSWSASSFPVLRSLSKTVASLALKAVTMTDTKLFQLAGYMDAPRDWKSVEGFPYDFLQLQAGSETHVVETDVVVVGTGPGGGVAAKNLAEAGHRVLVVEKGYYFPPSQFPMDQTSGLHYLYDNGQPYITEDGNTSVLTGSSWGGGGTINWSVSLRTQDYVRQEWADDKGLPFFATKQFDECLDRVWDFVGAGTDAIRHNYRNNVLLRGSEKLGWRAHPVAQNTGNAEHYCGRCTLGCGSNEKKGPAASWLPAAADHGAEFMEGFNVEKVTFAEDGTTATGVIGDWTSRGPDGDVSAPEGDRVRRRVQIKAKRVIVSCGTLQSPLILKRSGIENEHVGKNLHLHPANMVTATFAAPQDGWEGGIITSCNDEFENLDQHGHGVKMETTCMVPFTCLSSVPWTSGLDAKLMLARFSHLASFVSIVRDRDTGTVFPDPRTGLPRLAYAVSDFDRDHALQGIEGMVKICYVQGALEIMPYIPGLAPLRVDAEARGAFEEGMARGEVKDPEFSDPKLKAWLKELWRLGRAQPLAPVASAHQMGTCRMAKAPEEGVVDPKGKVWGREGLYVADASVFPSASGVNPMVTNMAISDMISRGVSEDLHAQGGI